ncbi:hypothetical protein ACU4GR_25855 [Methylobacterium oryzae CBMB20]
MLRALQLAGDCDLDVALVSYGRPSPELRELVRWYDTSGGRSNGSS